MGDLETMTQDLRSSRKNTENTGRVLRTRPVFSGPSYTFA